MNLVGLASSMREKIFRYCFLRIFSPFESLERTTEELLSNYIEIRKKDKRFFLDISEEASIVKAALLVAVLSLGVSLGSGIWHGFSGRASQKDDKSLIERLSPSDYRAACIHRLARLQRQGRSPVVAHLMVWWEFKSLILENLLSNLQNGLKKILVK